VATRKPLRTVKDDETAEPATEPAKRKSLTEAIESGTYLEILIAQRHDIVEGLPKTSGAPLAAMHKTLRELSKEIEQLEELARQRGGEDAEGDAAAADEPWSAEAL
jgi:hypothetical protein